MTNQELGAAIIAALDLDPPPIAAAFVDQPPVGIDTIQTDLPSACSFWRRAEQGVFYASAEAHFNCPVGAMVMGFELPEAVANELQQLVSNMCSCGYISSDEPVHIPTMQTRPKGIVYGPLRAFPIPADVVVCWLSPLQAMIWNEASGQARWNRDNPRRSPGDQLVPHCRPASAKADHFCLSGVSECAPSQRFRAIACWQSFLGLCWLSLERNSRRCAPRMTRCSPSTKSA